MVGAEPLTPMSTRGVEISTEFQIDTDSRRRSRAKMQAFQHQEYPISAIGKGFCIQSNEQARHLAAISDQRDSGNVGIQIYKLTLLMAKSGNGSPRAKMFRKTEEERRQVRECNWRPVPIVEWFAEASKSRGVNSRRHLECANYLH